MTEVIPAILSKTVEDAQAKIDAVAGLVPLVQIDIADGKFTEDEVLYDPSVAGKFNGAVNFDLHLMILNPEEELDEWIRDPRVKRISFHIEASKNAEGLIEKIHEAGLEAGLANNPETDIKDLEPYLNKADMVLCLGVRPGKGGQEFMPDILSKVRALKDKGAIVGVDGGVNDDTAQKIVDAGAKILVVGNFLFKSQDLILTLSRLKFLSARK